MALWRSTLTVSAMTMLSRIVGMVRDMVMFNVFGAGSAVDTFLMAFRIPNFFRRLFAEGAFSQAFIPVLNEYKTQRIHAEVQILISRVFGALLLVMTLITLLGMIFAPAILHVYAGGFASDPAKFAQLIDLFRLTFPYLLFMSLTAFASSILNTYGSFTMPAFAPVLLNLVMIGFALCATSFFDPPIMSMGWAVFVAGALQLAIQLPELWKKKLLIPPKLDFQHEGVQRILKLMLPALFGVSVTQINLLLNSFWASHMQDGSVSWLYGAERMTELPLGLIGVAIGTVILPSLSSKKAEQDMSKFRATLDWATKVIILVGMPASIALSMLAMPIIQTIFQHGEFSLRDAQMTAMALQCMSGGVIAYMLIKVFAPGFYAQQDTKTPVRIGMITVFANMAITLILLGIFHLIDWKEKHLALALASSGSAIVNAVLLYVTLHRRNIFRFEGHWRKTFVQFAAANAVMALVLWMGLHWYDVSQSAWMRAAMLSLLCVVGAASYAAALLALGFRPRHLKPASE
ncbi:murein biosynthesis integral membrane protein MurJ [Acinetobacter sp. c1-l78]|uniref:murein biosynthesis integral membrane protein MurJ n=1 Tax=Acinetobacter sp. c1-l78 TaxID=3342803 RepID=UPI0035B94166